MNKAALGCVHFKKHGCITTNQQTGRKYKSCHPLTCVGFQNKAKPGT